ncbi:MAG TPA: YgjP-like metallopeptidase domain-containing protein, partial [Tissierellaceae bacterium]|nr:YgjP-like metallopeptidase domain-containing protein [Tissierellaceae bacterium]
MIYSVEYADKEIEFKLIRKSVKNINLRVKADMTVVVSANHTVPLGVIMDFVKEKSPWILKHLEKFEKVQPISKSKKEYVSGESFRYLGRQYRLKVFESDTE